MNHGSSADAGVLYRDGALADGRSDRLRLGISILVRDGRVAWMGPAGDEPDPGDARIVDAGGCAVVPAMVDAHSHLSLPGGSSPPAPTSAEDRCVPTSSPGSSRR